MRPRGEPLSPDGGRGGWLSRRGALAPARRQRQLGPGSGHLPHREFQPGAHGGRQGSLTLRADSGFYNDKVVDVCRLADARYSITVKFSKGLRKLIEAIDDPLGHLFPTCSTVPTWPRPHISPSAPRAGRVDSSCAGYGRRRAASWPCSPSSPTTPSS
jgi:hypothetical protein